MIDHESDLRVGVVNDFCIISPESANDWKNYKSKLENNHAMPDTLSVSLKSSYKNSEHSLDMFPDVIQQACQNKTLLDVEYIAQSEEEGTLSKLEYFLVILTCLTYILKYNLSHRVTDE